MYLLSRVLRKQLVWAFISETVIGVSSRAVTTVLTLRALSPRFLLDLTPVFARCCTLSRGKSLVFHPSEIGVRSPLERLVVSLLPIIYWHKEETQQQLHRVFTSHQEQRYTVGFFSFMFLCSLLLVKTSVLAIGFLSPSPKFKFDKRSVCTLFLCA